jgi:hypothetical protein
MADIHVDETIELFIIFKVPLESADADLLAAFLKEVVLSIEVAITDTPRQSDSGTKREKFEGSVVYATTVQNESESLKEEIDGHRFVAWSLSVPISQSH